MGAPLGIEYWEFARGRQLDEVSGECKYCDNVLRVLLIANPLSRFHIFWSLLDWSKCDSSGRRRRLPASLYIVALVTLTLDGLRRESRWDYLLFSGRNSHLYP